MIVAVVVARVLLGLVFLAAGATKARDPAWPLAARSFALPAPLARALPYGEVVLGAVLVVGLWPRAAAAAALASLAGFSGAVGWRLAHGRRPACACFGPWSSRPIGWSTLGRNAVLAALAAVVLL